MGGIDFSGIAALANEGGRIAQAAPNAYAQSVEVQGERQRQQSVAQDMEIKKRALADQDALTKAMTQYDPAKNTLADIPKLITTNGGSGAAALKAQAGLIEQRQNLLKLSDDQFALQQKKNDAIQGVHDQVSQAPAEQKQQVYQQGLQSLGQLGVDVSKEPPQYPGDEAFAQHLPAIRLHSALLEEAQKDRDLSAKETEAAAAQTSAGAKAQEARFKEVNGALYDVSGQQPKIVTPQGVDPQQWSGLVDQVVPGQANAQLNQRTKSEVGFYLSQGNLKAAQDAVTKAGEQVGAIEKDVAVAKQTQPLKIEQARVEGQTRQLIQGMTEPVYAFDPKTGKKSLMSKTDALQAGIKTMLPVTEKEVSDDTMLNNRLADVHQKIARYEESLKQSVNSSDQTNMAALLDSQKLRIGAFGTEFPTGRFDAMLQKENLQGLSPAARDQLVAYRNAREALVGYNRVLSGSGKSSDKALELQEQTLPDPSISDKDFSSRAITQFKENLGIVGQGLPTIPGVKSPEEWEQQVAAPKTAASQPAPKKPVTGWGSQFGGVAH